jgi:hypothetical protein
MHVTFPNTQLKRPLYIVVLGIVMLAICLPRAIKLDQFVTPDEHLWLSRSANFYFALGQRDFASTYQKEHPGVTIMWAGTLGFLMRFPGYRGSGVGQLLAREFNYYIDYVAPVPPLDLLVAARAIVILGHTLVLFLALLYAIQLIGFWPAVVGFLLIAFDPFHLALTRLLHLDGLFSNLVLLSVLAFTNYLIKRRWYDLLISGLAAGAGWLTKSPALFLGPIVASLSLIFIFRELLRSKGVLPFIKKGWQAIWPVLLWFIIGVVLFVAIWPAMWKIPDDSVVAIFTKTENYAEEGHHSPIFFNGEIIKNGQMGIEYFYFYPLTYLWRSTPVEILGLLLACLAGINRWKPLTQKRVQVTLWGLLLIVGVYTLGMTLGAKKFDRYLLPIYAPLDIIAGIGWVAFAGWLYGQLIKRVNSRLAIILPTSIIAGAILVQAAGSLSTFPYYFSYYNPLMGGSQNAPQVMQIGWGEGLDEAARYLNTKNSAADLHVMSWYSPGSFSYFFKGDSRFLGSQTKPSQSYQDKFFNSEYAVIYIHQWQRQIPGWMLEFLSNRTPEHTVWINGIEYVRIYRIR